jgi:hypothetical protein
MLWQYIAEVGGTAFDAASGEVALIEFFILFTVLVILWSKWFFRFKSHGLAETQQARSPEEPQWLEKIKRFLSEDKFRIAFFTIILVIFHFLFYAPYRIYKEKNEHIGELEKDKTALQAPVDALNHMAFSDLWGPALAAYDNGDYRYSCTFFERFYTNLPQNDRYWTMKPLYITAVLKADLAEHGYTPEAVGRFERSMEDLTNTVSVAVNDNLVNDYNNAGVLDHLLVNLRKSRDRMPTQQETNFMKEVIETTESLRGICIQRERGR